MMVGIEYLIVAILMSIFSNGGVLSIIYLMVSMVMAIVYFVVYMKKYKRLEEEKIKLKTQISYKLIIVSMMIITINLVYRLDIINLILGYCLLGYFIILFIFRVCKKTLINKLHFMNFNYLFDTYSIGCLMMIFWEMMNYAV